MKILKNNSSKKLCEIHDLLSIGRTTSMRYLKNRPELIALVYH